MKHLMSASEARELSSTYARLDSYVGDLETYRRLMGDISYAIEKGEFHCHLDYEVSSRLIELLKAKDYNVEESDYNILTTFKIRWNPF
jgi:putative IMPACT (imprinted ancient) family translation regulator